MVIYLDEPAPFSGGRKMSMGEWWFPKGVIRCYYQQVEKITVGQQWSHVFHCSIKYDHEMICRA